MAMYDDSLGGGLPSYAGRARRRGGRRAGVPAGFDLLDNRQQEDAVRYGVVGGDAAAEVDARDQRTTRQVLDNPIIGEKPADYLDVKGPNKGRVKPQYEALVDANSPETRAQALAGVAAVQAEQKAKIEEAAMKDMRAQRSRLGTVKSFHDKALKEFAKGEGAGLDFQPDGKGGEIDVGAMAGRIADLRRKAGERVGTIKGALTPGISAGDPTDEATKAAAELPAAEKQYQLILEKRNRIKGERDRVAKAYADVNGAYAHGLLKKLGLDQPEAPTTTLQDSSVAEQGLHEPQVAGSTPAPAPTLKPVELLKMHQRIADIGETIDGAGANLDQKVVGMLHLKRKALQTEFDREFSRQPAPMQQRLLELTKDATLGQKIGGGLLNVAAGAGEALVDTGEFIARNAKYAPNLLVPGITKLTPEIVRQKQAEGDKKVVEFANAMRGEAEAWNDWIPEKARGQVNSGFWTGDVAKGAGSTLAFMAPSSVIGGLGRVAGLTEKAVGGLVTASVAATGAAAEGNSFRREAEGHLRPQLEAGQITQEEYDRSLGMAEIFGAAVGTTEALPVSRFARRVAEVPAGRTFLKTLLDVAGKGGGKRVAAWIKGPGKKMLVDVLSEGIEESGQEFGQNLSEDLYAKQTFDPGRKVGDTAANAAAVGGISGVLFSALTSALGAPKLTRRYKALGAAVNRGATAAKQSDGGGDAGNEGGAGVATPPSQGPSPSSSSRVLDSEGKPLPKIQTEARVLDANGQPLPATPAPADEEVQMDDELKGELARKPKVMPLGEKPKTAEPAPAATPEVLAGEKLSKEWTAFSPESKSLGIPRADMPQVKAEHRGALTNFLKGKGITSTEEEVLPGTLKPTQAEYSQAKVDKARKFEGGDRAILVSADGHVVDGHHQWMAKLTDAPDKPMRVIRLDAPVKDLLQTVKEFPSAETAGGATPPATPIAQGPKAEPEARPTQGPAVKPEAPVATTPAGPVIARGQNTAAKFVKAATEVAKVKGDHKAAKFLADFARRIHAAAPEAFAQMEVRALDNAAWAKHQATSRTPDSSAAYNPDTNTLYLNSERLTPENLANVVVHEAGHFADKFYLGEQFTQGEWAKLNHRDRVAAWNAYSGEQNGAKELDEDVMLNDRQARTEWVAMQFTRVVRGDTAGMSEQLKAKLKRFLADVRELVNKWVGNKKLTTPELDAKILEMLGYDKGPPAPTGKPAKPAPPAAPATKSGTFKKPSQEMDDLAKDIFGAPKDKGTMDMFEGGQHTGATDFTLQGEQATDFEGITAKKEAAAEAKRKADEAQGDLFGAPADYEKTFDPAKNAGAIKFAGMLVQEYPEIRSRAALAAFLAEKYPAAKPYSEAILNLISAFAPVDRSGTFDEAYSAGGKRTSPSDPQPRSKAPAGLAPVVTGQGPRTPNVPPKTPKGKSISVGLPASGEPDILNAIEDIGGVASRERAKDPGGEYDRFNETYSGTARLLIRRNGGQAPDQVARDLHEAGFLPDGDVNTLSAAVEKAVAARKNEAKQVARKQYEDRFERAFLGNEHPRTWLRAGQPITVDDLNAGDEFTVEGEKFHVVSVDENGNVKIKDGITKVVPPGTPVYPDKGEVTRAKPADDAGFDPFADNPPAQPEPNNEPRPDANLERDRPNPTAVQPGGQGGVQPEPGADGKPERPVGPGPAPEGVAGPGAGDAAARGEQSDSALPERQPGAIGPEASPAGGEQSGGGSGAGQTGILDLAGADTAVDSVAPDRPGKDVVAGSREQSLAERVRAQRDAESLDVVDADLGNIAKTLPVLLPEQHDDVLKAERRLLVEKPVEGDPKRGILFTNGTGTGKTFTGLGIVKRTIKRGQKDILILVPSFKKALDWVRDGKLVGVQSSVLESTSTAGEGVVVTTYANFRMNERLRNRDFNLVVYDESHKLMENEEGSATSGFAAHQHVTNHPDVLTSKVEERIVGPRPIYPGSKAGDQAIAAYREADAAWQEKRDEKRGEIGAEVARLKDYTKAVFLSATPFAYHKTLRYADGYLFDSPKARMNSANYNSPEGFDKFLVENFGYRMRYNKLTQPESGVDIDLMERAFADKLMKSGAVSGRAIDVPFDYSREFVLVDPGIGRELDRGMGVLYGWEDREKNNWMFMGEIARARFKYHLVQQLTEAIKAAQSIERIKQHLKLGRKVIVFHSYVNSLPSHPFRGLMEFARSEDHQKEIEEFEARYPELLDMDFGALANPLSMLEREFGRRVVFYNGNVPEGKRVKAVDAFNDDNSGVDIIVGQVQSIKEGVSLHDTTGQHMRVGIHLELPIRPTDATQEEGRGYRIGQASNTAHEYITIHTNSEKYAFGSKINERVRTAENLALGSQARALQTSFKQGYLNPVSAAPSENQGKGGKAQDRRDAVMTPFEQAKTFYFSRQKKTAKTKSAEGIDYFATPEPLGSKMVDWLLAKPDEHLLEPSVGHGAIGRFFPNFTNNHFVEQSYDLANEARIKIDKGAIHTQPFEDFDIHNKADGIAMNPPFGLGGSTAVKHLAKAVQHLKDGGRIVALIPEGPAADERFAKFYEASDKNIIKVAEFGLPQITFERAGTAVKTRIVVLDRIDDQNQRSEARTQARIDISAESINELFDRIESLEVPPRTAPKVAAPAPNPLAGGRGAVIPVAGAAGDFSSEEFAHTKTGAQIYVAKPTRHLGDDFGRIKSMAIRHGGYWSSFKGAGAIPGFHFKTEAARNAFLDEHTGGATFGSPPEIPQVNKNEEVPGQKGHRYRSHPDSLINAGIETARQIYKTRNNVADDATAKDIIKQLGETMAANLATDTEADIPGAVKTAIAVNLQRTMNRRRFDASATPEERRAAKRMSNRLAEVKGEEFTDMGQAIQFLARLNDYSEEGVLMSANRAVKDRQKRMVGPGGVQLTEEQVAILQKANEAAIDEATAGMDRALRSVRVGKSIWKQYQEKAAQSWLSRIASNLGELAVNPPLKEFTDRLVRAVQAKIDEALPPGERPAAPAPIQVIAEAINNREKYKEAWDAARAEIEERYADQPDVLEKLDESMAGLLDRPFSDKTLDRAIKAAHTEMGIKVRDIVRMHYSQVDALGQSLADKLVEQAKLKKDDADRLAANIKARFAELTKEAKQKALARLGKGKGGMQKRIAALAEKFIAMSNAGALHSSDYFEMVAHELGLPSLSEAQAEKLRDLAGKAQSKPEGFQRDRVMTDLLSELQKLRGVGTVDIATAVYYSHILSGYTTQAVNGISTALNTLADILVTVGRHPTTAGQAIRGIRDGAKTGFVQALSILDTGYAHRGFDEKLPEVSPVIEMLAKDQDRNAALRGYSHLLKWVGRGMKAVDAVFFQTASEAYQRVAAAKLAGMDGMDRKTRAAQVRDLLAMSPGEFEAARQQARAEGLTGLDYELRVAEIIHQKRDPKAYQAGVDFGRMATFNNEPRGYLGAVARKIGETSKTVPIIRLFVPFTNIVSNVTNASLNYSPLGVVRAVKGYGGEQAPGREERDTLLIKGIAGSLGLLALLAYGMGDDDRDPPWITANGPSDPSARNQLRQTGWKPHSIKVGGAYVSYLETPFALPLALVGNYIDARHYNKVDEKDVSDMLLTVLGGQTETVFNMSFLQGLGNLMDVVRGKPGAVKQFAGNTVAGITVPNLVRQVDRTFDPTIYDTRGLKGVLVGQVPGIRQTFPERMNVVGNRITSHPLDRFGRAETNDPLWDTLARQQAWIPEAGKTTKIDGRVMTPEEHRAYVETSGHAIEQRLRAAAPAIDAMTAEKADDFVQKVTREERAKAKTRVRRPFVNTFAQ